MPENYLFSVDPDVVTQAIKLLCWVIGIFGGGVALLGGALIKVLLYIWGKAEHRMSNIENKMDKIAGNIEGMDKNTSVEIASIKLRCSLIHKDEPFARVRSSDIISMDNNKDSEGVMHGV